MYIARWQLTTLYGRTDDCISILRKWERDVGERIGWRSGSVRILSSVLGASDSEVELEARFDDIADFESARNDMARTPRHKEYQEQLAALIVDGSSRWSIYREAPLLAAD